MKLAIGLLLASWAPDFTAANLRRTEERALEATGGCGDCCKAIDQAASIVQSALLGCGHAATGYSGGGSGGWGVSSTAMAYQPPNPTCLLILCAAQRSASALVRNACSEEYEPVIGADICEYVPGFTPPIANNDFGTITQGDTKGFAVLENDRAVPDRYLVISAITRQANKGTCVVKFNQNNKELIYEAGDDTGSDSCEYETCYENGPRLCDTATLTMDIIASPTQAPTTAPTNSPIEGCNIGLDITCLDCDDQDLATIVECTDRPTAMTLKYIGGKCGQGNNNQNGDLSCTDYVREPPTQGNAFIKVTSDKGVYFEGTQKVGDFSPLVSPKGVGKEFESNLKVVIYESQGGNKLQEIEFHSSCSKNLFLLDKFGAVQIASFTNEDQNKVTVRGKAKLKFGVSNDSSEDITNIELKLFSRGPIPFTRVITSNLNLGEGEVKNILWEVPLDLSVQQNYRYVLNAEGTGDNRICTGTVERVFLIPSADRV